ncbi:MAG: hypothetical protein ACREUR_08860, partial [Nitrosospira sp.]
TGTGRGDLAGASCFLMAQLAGLHPPACALVTRNMLTFIIPNMAYRSVFSDKEKAPADGRRLKLQHRRKITRELSYQLLSLLGTNNILFAYPFYR